MPVSMNAAHYDGVKSALNLLPNQGGVHPLAGGHAQPRRWPGMAVPQSSFDLDCQHGPPM